MVINFLEKDKGLRVEGMWWLAQGEGFSFCLSVVCLVSWPQGVMEASFCFGVW